MLLYRHDILEGAWICAFTTHNWQTQKRLTNSKRFSYVRAKRRKRAEKGKAAMAATSAVVYRLSVHPLLSTSTQAFPVII